MTLSTAKDSACDALHHCRRHAGATFSFGSRPPSQLSPRWYRPGVGLGPNKRNRPCCGPYQGRSKRSSGRLQARRRREIRHAKHRRQRPVERGRLQLILAPQDLEQRVLQDVGDLEVAEYLDPVNDWRPRARILGDRDVAYLQSVCIQDFDAVAQILRLSLVAEVDRNILAAEKHRTDDRGWHQQQLGRLHPSRGWSATDLVGLCPGGTDNKHQCRKQPPARTPSMPLPNPPLTAIVVEALFLARCRRSKVRQGHRHDLGQSSNDRLPLERPSADNCC